MFCQENIPPKKIPIAVIQPLAESVDDLDDSVGTVLDGNLLASFFLRLAVERSAIPKYS